MIKQSSISQITPHYYSKFPMFLPNEVLIPIWIAPVVIVMAIENTISTIMCFIRSNEGLKKIWLSSKIFYIPITKYYSSLTIILFQKLFWSIYLLCYVMFFRIRLIVLSLLVTLVLASISRVETLDSASTVVITSISLSTRHYECINWC